MDLSKFDVVLGAGGYGEVRGSTELPLVVKFMRSRVTCMDGKREFEMQNTANEAIADADLRLTKLSIDLTSPEAVEFDPEPWGEFSCYVVMERLYSPREDNVMYQLAFNVDSPDRRDTVIYYDYKTETETQTKGIPRGFFASPGHAESLLNAFNTTHGTAHKIEDVHRQMGRAFMSMIAFKNIGPVDVEYCLVADKTGKALRVAALDFGLCEPFEFRGDDSVKYTYAIPGSGKKFEETVSLKKYARISFRAYEYDVYWPDPSTHPSGWFWNATGMADVAASEPEGSPTRKLAEKIVEHSVAELAMSFLERVLLENLNLDESAARTAASKLKVIGFEPMKTCMRVTRRILSEKDGAEVFDVLYADFERDAKDRILDMFKTDAFDDFLRRDVVRFVTTGQLPRTESKRARVFDSSEGCRRLRKLP